MFPGRAVTTTTYICIVFKLIIKLFYIYCHEMLHYWLGILTNHGRELSPLLHIKAPLLRLE